MASFCRLQLAKSFAVKTNDLMMVVYLGSLIRSVIVLHNLVNNRLENAAREEKAGRAWDAEQEAAPEDEEAKKAEGAAAEAGAEAEKKADSS